MMAQITEKSDIIYDPDSSMDTWKNWFLPVFKKEFGRLFDFDHIFLTGRASCCRCYVRLFGDEGGPNFKLAGDCDFNFNEKKFELFKELLSEKDIPLLEECCRNHHQFHNFSLMPITGGMNNFKGCLRVKSGEKSEPKAYDRLDAFLVELDKYYNGEHTAILARTNGEYLAWYLGLFRDVYDYCGRVYLIQNRRFVDELLTSGKNMLADRESVLQYMDLANRYWNLRKGYVSEKRK